MVENSTAEADLFSQKPCPTPLGNLPPLIYGHVAGVPTFFLEMRKHPSKSKDAKVKKVDIRL